MRLALLYGITKLDSHLSGWGWAILVLWVPCPQITNKSCKFYFYLSIYFVTVFSIGINMHLCRNNLIFSIQAQDSNIFRHYVSATAERDGKNFYCIYFMCMYMPLAVLLGPFICAQGTVQVSPGWWPWTFVALWMKFHSLA